MEELNKNRYFCKKHRVYHKKPHPYRSCTPEPKENLIKIIKSQEKGLRDLKRRYDNLFEENINLRKDVKDLMNRYPDENMPHKCPECPAGDMEALLDKDGVCPKCGTMVESKPTVEPSK